MVEKPLEASVPDPVEDTEAEHPEDETSSDTGEETPLEDTGNWEKRYKDLQRTFTKLSQDVADMKKAPSGTPVTDQQDATQQYWDWFARDPSAAMGYLVNYNVQQAVAPLQAQWESREKARQMAELKRNYPDAKTVLPLIEQLEQDLPQVVSAPDLASRPDRMELLYHLAKGYYKVAPGAPSAPLQKSQPPKTLSAEGPRPIEKTSVEELDEQITEAVKKRDSKTVARLLVRKNIPFEE